MEQAEADAVAALLSAATSGDIAPVDKGVEIAEEPSGALLLCGAGMLPLGIGSQQVVLGQRCLQASLAQLLQVRDKYTNSALSRNAWNEAAGDCTSGCSTLSAECMRCWAERKPEYLVKWLGRSHMHDEWVGEALLGRLAKRKLVNFKRRHGDAPCMLADPAWRVPERLVARRPSQAGPGWEVLVKWTGLGYESATWEARARLGICGST